MPSISEIRQQYPQYSDMSDADLADALHRKFYSDMPREQFNAAIGYSETLRPSGRHRSFDDMAQAHSAPPADDALSMTRAGLGGVIEGIPVVGPMIRGGVERAAAGTIAAFSDESYEDALKRIQAGTEAEKAANPTIDTAAQVTGAVGGTIPMVMAAPAAFGAGSGPLWMRSLASMASGAGIGGTDAAVRAEGDPSAIWDGTMWGGGLGLAGPAVGKAVGTAARKGVDAYRNWQVAQAAGTRSATVTKLAKAITADGLDDAALRARLDELGPEPMLADLGPNLRGQAAALANMPGPAQKTVRTALETRHADANTRIGAAVDDTMGSNVVPSTIDEGIAANQRAVAPLYDEAFQDARAVDTSRIAEGLDSQIVNLRGDAQRAVQRVRSMLNIHGTDVLDPNPGTLFQARQAIDGLLATEQNPKVIQALTAVRRQVDDTLAGSVPGIKEADAAYAELARQREALQRGQTVLSSGRESPRPLELAREVQEGALPQGTQIGPSAVPLRLSQGARAEIDRILGANANDVAALNRLIRTEGDWNRARLASLFGDEKAARLMRVLEAEKTFAATRDFATGNSATAGRQQAIQDLSGGGEGFRLRDAYSVGGGPAAVRAGGMKLMDKLVDKILGGYREGANASLADAITGQRSALIDALAKRQGGQYNPALVEAIAKSILLGSGTAGTR
ncbi:hypothetical protein [Ensifer aridi]|uniref:hypothetical protein n=1 Tax=Ensifer aridi TaxID=1708715 RepID=UPI00111C89E7|nr:hypothetical protein [Ensifer aridi]